MQVKDIVAALRRERWDDGRLDVLAFIMDDHGPLTVADAVRILGVFKWDDSKVDAVRLLAHHITDPENGHSIGPVFKWDDGRAEAREVLRSLRAPNGAMVAVDPAVTGSDDARDQVELQRQLVALEREAAALAAERQRLRAPWYVRALLWVARLFGGNVRASWRVDRS